MALVLAMLVVLVVLVVAVRGRIAGCRIAGSRDDYSVGYQIGPHYLSGASGSTWAGDAYALSPARCAPGKRDGFTPAAPFTPHAPPDDGPRGTNTPPALVYTPPLTRDLRGNHPSWWRSDGGTYGLPPAAERPDFWAGDTTLHTYHARDAVPQHCGSDAVAGWRHYGGPKGWNMSPYY